MANTSIYSAFERFWLHVVAALGEKADASSVQTQLDAKVDVVSGKGLSTNDYTNEDKIKLDGIVEMTPDDAMTILGEVGALEFTTDENGAVLTDENGAILVI